MAKTPPLNPYRFSSVSLAEQAQGDDQRDHAILSLQFDILSEWRGEIHEGRWQGEIREWDLGRG